MSPGLGEVGIEVSSESGTAESFMGAEDLWGSSGHGCCVHNELVWSALNWVVFLNIFSAVLFDGVVLDHGSHEDVIIIGGEIGWGDSLVSSSSEHLVLSWDPVLNLKVHVVWNIIVLLEVGNFTSGGPEGDRGLR